MAALDDAARMAVGIAAIRENATRAHPEIGTGAPPPLEITGRVEHGDRRLKLSVQCPYCKARPGAPCQITTRRTMAGFHPARADAADAARSAP